MAWDTFARGRVWLYSHSIGRAAISGTGFSFPIKSAMLPNGLIYVTNRGGEQFPCSRISKITIYEEFIKDFGQNNAILRGIAAPSPFFTWLNHITLDLFENIYVSDEWNDMITIFDQDGAILNKWGYHGQRYGEIDGAAGVCFDRDQNIWVVSSRTSRIQKFTTNGVYITGFGSQGDGPDELQMPSGICIDRNNDIYIADWGNHRIQKYDYNGNYITSIGHDGRLSYPIDLTIDNDGDIYVANWMNNNVVIYDQNGLYLATLYGDATDLSLWGEYTVESNPDIKAARRRVPDLERQQSKLKMPMGVTFEKQTNILIVCDTMRSRLQIYQKNNQYKPANVLL